MSESTTSPKPELRSSGEATEFALDRDMISKTDIWDRDCDEFVIRASTRWPAALDALDEAKREIDKLRQRVAELEGALRVDAQRYRDEVDKIRANHSLAMEDAGRKMGGYLGETVRLEKELTHARAVVEQGRDLRDVMHIEGYSGDTVRSFLAVLQTYDDYMAKQGGGQ